LAAVNRAGNALRGLGVEPEQRVAMLLPDGLAWVATFFGALRIGAVAVPLNTRLRVDDYVAILQDSRAKVLVTDATLGAQLAARRADLPHLRTIVTTDSAAGFPCLDALLAGAAPGLEPEAVSPDDMAFWLYTSGTTGAPKGAVHLHRDLLASHHYGVEVLGMTADDRVLATSRLFFAYALGNALLIPLRAGASVFLHPAWPDPALVTDVMARFRPTVLFSVPTFYARMLHAGLPPETFRSLRFGVSAGERLPGDLYLAYRDRFGVELLDGMGATETIFMVLSNRAGRSHPGSSGTPVPGTEVRLLDADGREVAPGQEGVLHVKTPSASPFYWNRVERSRRTFVGEWFRTGDVYTRDADGFYYHCGREDDFFKVAGQWVAPAEVEAVLLSHPEVADAGVVGTEEAGGLVKPFAFVVPRDPGATSARLVAELAGLTEKKLPSHQRPRRIFIVPELPRTATGKLQRFRLRAEADARRPPAS
ncbi:MAG TPA: benzoate-CoA ligase family protein, partial [Methylomirabilota bacterium]|nr:benzoate-CoA ligase family protein [Methylomirabilota bacterium]